MGQPDTSQSVRANRRFIKRTMATALLDADHELELARAWRDRRDEKALHELTSA
jgi:RNA polymerase sigma-32 factor